MTLKNVENHVTKKNRGRIIRKIFGWLRNLFPFTYMQDNAVPFMWGAFFVSIFMKKHLLEKGFYMKTVNGVYTSANIFTDIVENYAISQIQMLCNNEALKECRIRIMPDVHPGKVGTCISQSRRNWNADSRDGKNSKETCSDI